MRYGDDHKEKTHEKIVEQASQEFRRNGFEGVAISKLMAKLGLTHGGFYAHFQDKEDLKDQAMEFALDQSFAIAANALRGGGVPAYIDHYTSELHRDYPEFGCLLPSLSAEEGRRSSESRAKFAQKYFDFILFFTDYLPGKSLDEKKGRAHFMISAMSGSIALARAAGDPLLSAAVLRSTREQLTHYFRSL